MLNSSAYTASSPAALGSGPQILPDATSGPGHHACVAIEVAPYDPAWPTAFARIQTELSEALRGVPIRAIEHIGSTAVPGLAAKPQIDVDVIVRRDDLNDALAALTVVGYEHR